MRSWHLPNAETKDEDALAAYKASFSSFLPSMTQRRQDCRAEDDVDLSLWYAPSQTDADQRKDRGVDERHLRIGRR